MKHIISLFFICVITFFALSAKADIVSIAETYQKGNLHKAISLSNHHKYKYLHLYLKASEFLEKNNKASFETIAHFLASFPDLPIKEELIVKLESKILSNTSKNAIIKWFTHNKPKTPNGYISFYKAATGKIHKQEAMDTIIKNAWIYGEFAKNEETAFYEKNKSILNQSDHADKISELLRKNNIKAATGLLYLVNKDYKKAFIAWIAIIQNKPDLERAFHEVRGSYKYIPGLLYAYLNLHKKAEPTEELVSLHQKTPKNSVYQKEWWSLKNYLARELIDRKKFALAYKVITSHANIEKIDLVDAEWLAGWLALEFLNKPELSKKHFKIVEENARTCISRARGSYWLARSYAKLGDKIGAELLYKKAAKYGYSFYGMLAAHELGYKNL
ncbi:MAG: hypothetical protein SFT68_00835, partial [Rickettsiaceae bacterium]|nr:hypothetical protein [Rickettsiaceae bacterium]